MKELTSKKLDRILIAAAVLGLVCGGVRGLQLNTFDEKNLPTGNGTLDIVLWAALALCVAAAFGVWFAVKKAAIAPGESSPGMGERLFSLGGAVFFGLGAALRLAMSYRPFSVWGVLLALICIAVAAAIPVAAKTLGNGASPSRGEKLISLVPVMASVVLMIELYRGVSRNPTVSWYAADVFAMAAVILVFFAVAGDAVGRTGPAKVVATAFAAVSLGLCAAVGRAVRLASDLISGGSPADLVCAESFQLLLFAGAVLFAVGAAKAVVRRGVRIPGEEQEN